VTIPAEIGPIGHVFKQNHLVLFKPIVRGGEHLGTIYLLSDMKKCTRVCGGMSESDRHSNGGFSW